MMGVAARPGETSICFLILFRNERGKYYLWGPLTQLSDGAQFPATRTYLRPLSMTSLLGLEMEVGERKTPDFLGCWLLAKEHRTNSGSKSKVFVDPHSQRSEDRGSRVGSFSGSVVISRTHSNLLG